MLTIRSRAAQLEKLENKIEHLVNALANNQTQRGYSIDLGQASPDSQASERSNSRPRTTDVLNTLCDGLDDTNNDPPISVPTMSSDTKSTYTTSPTQLVSPDAALPPPDCRSLGVSLLEAEILFDRYRRLMANNMPFVKVPYCTTHQMYTDRPVLLQSIVTVTYFHEYPTQQNMVKRLIRNITERVFIDGEKSLDILQAVLVLVAWFHPHIFTIPQCTNLLHIAQALTIDLGFDRPPQSASDMKPPHKPGQNHPAMRQHATMAEHRAYLGTFYLTSMLSSPFRKCPSMRKTPYLEEALKALQEAQEYESDLLLIQMFRLQLLADDAVMVDTPTAPVQMYVKAFQADLEQLKKDDPCKAMDNVTLQLQYLAVDITIRELPLNELQGQSQISTPLRSHLDELYYCVKAIRQFFEVFFTIDASLYLTVPFTFFGQFAHCFIALLKIVQLEIDGWNMKALHEQLNFSETIEETAKRYEDGSKYGPDGLTLNNESFMKWSQWVRWMKQMYESKLNPDSEGTENRAETKTSIWARPDDQQPTPAAQQPTPPDEMLSGDFFNYLDDNFWQSFAGEALDLGFPDMNML